MENFFFGFELSSATLFSDPVLNLSVFYAFHAKNDKNEP